MGFQIIKVQVSYKEQTHDVKYLCEIQDTRKKEKSQKVPPKNNRLLQKNGEREWHLTQHHPEINDKGARSEHTHTGSSKFCQQLFPSQNLPSSQIINHLLKPNKDSFRLSGPQKKILSLALCKKSFVGVLHQNTDINHERQKGK